MFAKRSPQIDDTSSRGLREEAANVRPKNPPRRQAARGAIGVWTPGHLKAESSYVPTVLRKLPSSHRAEEGFEALTNQVQRFVC